jgi:cell division transport system ATP-binding protein
MIRFDHVSKQYAGHSALSDVTVEIQDGEFVFLIGHSGAGKTTILRLLIHEIAPSEGSLHVDEWNVSELPKSQIYKLRRHVGTVFQDFKLLMDRTVYENVSLGLEILGKAPKEINTRVMDVLELVRLEHRKNYFPLQLSAGEMQRVAIARAIVGGPSILLADEPTGNLDPQTSWDILDILKEIHKIGTTIVMATHNETIVNDMKKRTITLDQGKIIHDEEKGKYRVALRGKGKQSHASNA